MANVGSPFMNSCILTAVGVFAIMVNSCVISKIGRRRVFLMAGLLICGISQIIIAAVYHVNPGTGSTGKVRFRAAGYLVRKLLTSTRLSLGFPLYISVGTMVWLLHMPGLLVARYHRSVCAHIHSASRPRLASQALGLPPSQHHTSSIPDRSTGAQNTVG